MNDDFLLAGITVFYAVVLVAISKTRAQTRSDRLELRILAVGLVVIAAAVGIPTLSQTTAQAVVLWGALIVAIGALHSVRDWVRNRGRAL